MDCWKIKMLTQSYRIQEADNAKEINVDQENEIEHIKINIDILIR
jgi:hypothetical protein